MTQQANPAPRGRAAGIDLVGPRKWFFLASAIAVIASLVIIAIPPAFEPGIEFTSGTTAHYRFNRSVAAADLRAAYSDLGHPEARVQSTGNNEFLVRTNELEVPEGAFTQLTPTPTAVDGAGPAPVEPLGTLLLGAQDAEGQVLLRRPFQSDPCSFGAIAGRFEAGDEAQLLQRLPCDDGLVLQVLAGDVVGYIQQADTHGFTEAPVEEAPPPDPAELGERAVIEIELQERFGDFEVLEFSSVSAVVSSTAVRNAAVAVLVASFFIMGYIVYAFSGMPSPFRYGAAAVIALLHDVIIVLGAFSLFGKLFGMEINLMFVTALLTVIGYSVHDTIITFDRIRENVRYSPNSPFIDNVNAALLQTLSRSMNTSLTLVLVVAALLLLGGETLRVFLLAILIGLVAGAYSSLAIAAQLVVAWDEGDFDRFRFWKRDEPEGETRTAEA